ncbi:hypothetical protein KC340_g161 [Hortaea werneckii]|nr:hypothetical protein KC340_g161 [Hortaea werneckii]
MRSRPLGQRRGGKACSDLEVDESASEGHNGVASKSFCPCGSFQAGVKRRYLFIQLSMGEPIGATKLNSPALEDYFTVLSPVSGGRTRARLRRASKSIEDIPSFTVIVCDYQGLVLTKIGSVNIHLYDQRRRLVVRHIWTLPFSEILEQYVGIIDDYVELQDDRSAFRFLNISGTSAIARTQCRENIVANLTEQTFPFGGRGQSQHINISVVDFSADLTRIASDVSTQPKSLAVTKILILAPTSDEMNKRLTHRSCLISPAFVKEGGKFILAAQIINAALVWKCWDDRSAFRSTVTTFPWIVPNSLSCPLPAGPCLHLFLYTTPGRRLIWFSEAAVLYGCWSALGSWKDYWQLKSSVELNGCSAFPVFRSLCRTSKNRMVMIWVLRQESGHGPGAVYCRCKLSQDEFRREGCVLVSIIQLTGPYTRVSMP